MGLAVAAYLLKQRVPFAGRRGRHPLHVQDDKGWVRMTYTPLDASLIYFSV